MLAESTIETKVVDVTHVLPQDLIWGDAIKESAFTVEWLMTREGLGITFVVVVKVCAAGVS